MVTVLQIAIQSDRYFMYTFVVLVYTTRQNISGFSGSFSHVFFSLQSGNVCCAWCDEIQEMMKWWKIENMLNERNVLKNGIRIQWIYQYDINSIWSIDPGLFLAPLPELSQVDSNRYLLVYDSIFMKKSLFNSE